MKKPSLLWMIRLMWRADRSSWGMHRYKTSNRLRVEWDLTYSVYQLCMGHLEFKVFATKHADEMPDQVNCV